MVLQFENWKVYCILVLFPINHLIRATHIFFVSSTHSKNLIMLKIFNDLTKNTADRLPASAVASLVNRLKDMLDFLIWFTLYQSWRRTQGHTNHTAIILTRASSFAVVGNESCTSYVRFAVSNAPCLRG